VPVTCADAAPTFYAQLQDSDPASTDEFNNQYLTALTGADPNNDILTYVRTTPDIRKALIWTLDTSTGHLVDYPRKLFSLNVDEGNDFQLFSLNSAPYIEITGNLYVNCAVVPSGGVNYLECTQTTGPFPLTVLQTCPLYQEYFETPVVLGENYSPEFPTCFRKKIKMVPACVPKP
jgi:hypothetical protein